MPGSSSAAPVPGDPTGRALHLVGAGGRRLLDPVDRFAEIIFGLVMVLTFTGTISVARSGRQEIRETLLAALGCNVAWGIIDGVMYLVTTYVRRARAAAVVEGLRAADPDRARDLLLSVRSDGMAALSDEADLARAVARARALPPPAPPRLVAADLKAALASCLLVVLATLPPTLPFVLLRDAQLALRVSHGVAVLSLFVAGHQLGRATGVRAGRLGVAMVALGLSLVALTIALGG